MKIEIIDVKSSPTEYKGDVTNRKSVIMKDETINVRETAKSYPSIPMGYKGMADVEIDVFKNNKYFKNFTPLGDVDVKKESVIAKSTQKENVQITTHKADPVKLKQQSESQRAITYNACLARAIEFHSGKKSSEIAVLETTDAFFDHAELKLAGKILDKNTKEAVENIKNTIGGKVVGETQIDESF